MINRKSLKENNKKCFINLRLKFDDSYPSFTLDIKRSWDITNPEKIKEEFEIFRDNNPLEFIPKDYWQDYINYLIPPHVSEFFFFNGEKVKELAIGTNADEILKSSIKDLIELNLYENLLTDLNKLKSKIRRRNEIKGEISKKIAEQDSQKNRKLAEKMKIKKEITRNKRKIKEKENKFLEINEELKRKAGAFAQQKKDAEAKILTLQQKNAISNEQIATIAKDYLPFVIPEKLCKDLLKQLNLEQNHKNAKFIEEIWKDKIKEFSTKLEENSKILKKLSKKETDAIKKDIDSTFLQLFDTYKKSQVILLHDLTISEIENIKSFLKQANQNITTNFETLLHDRQKNSLKIGKVKKELNQIPDDTFVISDIDAIGSLKVETESLNKTVSELQEKIISLNNEIENIDNIIEKFEEEIVCIDEDEQKIDVINKINEAVNEYVKEMVSLNTKNLENTISSMYHNLSNKGDMIKNIRVDPYTFTTELFDFDGNPIKKDGISEGEREIYAISVLWGLSKISHHKLPMIIDTPLAKLDNKHVTNITSEFLPEASDQVILLSHDREIDERIYLLLKPRIYQSYTLMQSDENKIKTGYFFD